MEPTFGRGRRDAYSRGEFSLKIYSRRLFCCLLFNGILSLKFSENLMKKLESLVEFGLEFGYLTRLHKLHKNFHAKAHEF